MRYDGTDLPKGYDRARARSPEMVARWMDEVAAYVPPGLSVETILDLGCGTGRFSGALHERFDAIVVGFDPSVEMIGQAPPKHPSPPHHFVVGAGEEIALREVAVDLIFISMVFHHFADVPRVLRECRRVLAPDGFVFLRAGTRDRIPAYPTSRFFPATVEIMERTLVSVDEICDAFETAGFATREVAIIEQETAGTHGDYAARLAAGGDSVLAQLDPMDFSAGLSELRACAADVDPQPVKEPIDFLVFDRDADTMAVR